MTMQLLAEVAEAPKQFSLADLMQILGWVTAFVAMIGTVILVPMMKGKWQAQAKADVMVGPQPFEVRMEKEYMPRREAEQRFDRLELTIGVNATKMESLFERTMQAMAGQNTALTKKIESQNARLSTDIKEMGSGAYKGRKDIWEHVNVQREEVAALKINSNVAAEIGKLGEAITQLIETKS